MALFNKKQNTEKPASPAAAQAPAARPSAPSVRKHAGIILREPRITEKGSFLAEKGCYVFNVAPRATKREIESAVRAIYNVTPRLVRTVRTPGKRVVTRGTNRVGRSASGKKAYVFLKKGETIEIV